MRSIILFELNEVPFRVIDHYCHKYPESTLATILPQSWQYETLTKDEGHLHPWTTWPTLHRGVANDIHQIKDFGEDLSTMDRDYPSLWQQVVAHNYSVGVFASMHSYPPPENMEDYNFYVPDPFAQTSHCHPKSIEPFQAFNLSMARRSGRNVDSGIDKKSAAKLALSLPKLGIRPKTLKSTLQQLLAERTHPWKATRRRTFQSVLAFDIYMKLLNQHKPSFSTYLSNHVAATMHRYWAATFPDDYEENNLSDKWIETYQEEIDFAMHKFDGFLGDLVQFTQKNKGYKLVVASSMGQEATQAELLSTELVVEDLPRLMTALGLSAEVWDLLPAMHPQYNVKLHTPEHLERLRGALGKLIIDGKPLNYREKEGGFVSLDFGHTNLGEEDISFQGRAVAANSLGLKNEKIDEEASGTAYHIPEGSLFIYDPQDTAPKGERVKNVDTRAFAPSVLENFDIEVPAYMVGERIPGIGGLM